MRFVIRDIVGPDDDREIGQKAFSRRDPFDPIPELARHDPECHSGLVQRLNDARDLGIDPRQIRHHRVRAGDEVLAECGHQGRIR